MDVNSNAPPLPPPPNTANGRSPLDAFGDTLLELVPAIRQVAREPPATWLADQESSHQLAFDEFISALIKHAVNMKSPQVPIWLVSAAQSYLEIHNVLQGETSRGTEGHRSYLNQVQPIAKRAKAMFPLTYDSDLGDIRCPFFDNLIREKSFHHLEVTKEVAQIAKS